MQLSRKSNKKKVTVAILGGLILLGLIDVLAYQRGWIPGLNQSTQGNIIDGVNYDKATDQQKSAGGAAKEEFIKKDNNTNHTTGSDNRNSDNQSQLKKVDLIITNQNQTNGVYQFRTKISAIESDGSCTLKMSAANHQDIHKTIGVQVQGSYAVCAGYFDIPVSQLLGAAWNTTITYKSSQSTGVASAIVKVD